MQSLTELTKLKGVGPATASLILACYDEVNVPFFGDEVFEYLHSGNAGTGKKNSLKIRYSMKEYKSLFDEVKKLRERLDREGEVVRAVEVEKVAYVIMRGGGGGGDRDGDGDGDGDRDGGKDNPRKEKDSAVRERARKRKIQDRRADDESSSPIPTPPSTSSSAFRTFRPEPRPQRKKHQK